MGSLPSIIATDSLLLSTNLLRTKDIISIWRPLECEMETESSDSPSFFHIKSDGEYSFRI